MHDWKRGNAETDEAGPVGKWEKRKGTQWVRQAPLFTLQSSRYLTGTEFLQE
jgi:hypothetical protein